MRHFRYLEEEAAPTLESLAKGVKEAGDAANLDWMLMGGVLVFFMQSGFALLESGTVRYKNFQNVMFKNVIDACIGGLVWWAWGFAFAYGDTSEEKGGFIGDHYFFGMGLEKDAKYADWFF